MGNMSYCRFENTYSDLVDCKDALDNDGGLNELEDSELDYAKELIELCQEITDRYGDEL